MTQNEKPAAQMNAANLYLEELFTDRKVGLIRRMTPVKADGTPDLARSVLYVGEAQMMTAMGALPLSFEIPAKTLEEAVAGYGASAQLAVERAVKELQEMRRQAQSSLIIPETGAVPGGLPGGGKIKFP
mgnify:CR=1 FL=1